MKKITYDIEVLRKELEKLPKRSLKFHPDARHYVDVVDYDDVLGVLFGDIPEGLR